ncbi:uncharacterized protein LOC116844139 [Odontomachus brunneus]|uniref:uncharacterized protein LOC116844139 n=1 Tax=Odontomachus brunneus TaxID=486640 RepID=UPI0013F26E22|nr:uncharacterized protein LOC116844139 [Odontomachus brunneus]
MRGAEVTNMNISSSTSERTIPESSLRSQSQLHSCRLNDLESSANIMLKKIEQELDMTETKFSTLKSEMNYTIDVCRKGEMEVKESKGTFNTSHEQTTPLSKSRGSKSSVEYRNYTSALSPKSARFSPRGNVNNAVDAKCEIPKEETRKRLLNVTITPRTQSDKLLPSAITTMPVQNKTMEASVDREYKSLLSSCPEYVREYLQSIVSDSVKELVSRADEDYFCETPSCLRKDSRESELNSDRLENTKVRQAAKCKYVSGTPRNETNSTLKTSDAASKIRKRKGKLRSSVSKSTVTSKDTYLLNRKETKRRRNRGHGITRQQSALLKHTKKSNDVVEIFHNTTLKSSNSRVFAKYSKLGRGAKHAKKQNLAKTANQKTREKSHSEHVTREYQFRNKENQQNLGLEMLNRKSNPRVTTANNIQEQNKSRKHLKDIHLETLNYKSSPRVTADSVQEKNKSGKHFNDLSPKTLSRGNNLRVTTDNVQKQHKSEKHSNDSSTQCKIAHQCEHTVCSTLDDPMSIPNYEIPTLASKLKRSSRPYFGRFNFHNIPFVVSTSVTPSHNLGLNIQQVLSVMKTRQPTARGIAPLLIREVSRSAKPVSTFLEQINVQCDKSILDLKSQTDGQLDDKESLKQDRRLSVLELQHLGRAQSVHTAGPNGAKTIPKSSIGSGQLCREKGDFHEEYKVKQRSSLIKSRTSVYSRNQQPISRMSLSKQDNIGDHKTHIADPHNSKEIRDVLINLHDQFEEMNTRYEKLQSEVAKSNDANLPKELSTLEKQLHVKEGEINAVISLYKEVMSLKQQMKMLHERGSLVRVATVSSMEPHRNPFSISLVPGRSPHRTDTAQILGRGRGSNVYGATRDPPASVQLVALLRQIQTFHKQLQLVS